ncbi:MAG: MBL fold metallo-hydrolase [Phycisphaerales bacterium]|nr:MBL fold metallo-hydrolase [Phycisphaerales bacterium]
MHPTLDIIHLNCGRLFKPPGPVAACHCLLLRDPLSGEAALVDTGLGLADCRDPLARVGAQTIEIGGFEFHEELAALRRLDALGIDPASVTNILLTHLDPDHAGGLADFPSAQVHLSAQEHAAAVAPPPGTANPRYRAPQWSHAPRFRPVDAARSADALDFFGLPSFRPSLPGWEAHDLRLVPLFGHTPGHCAVAIPRPGNRWLLHAGDAYYLRAQFQDDAHPVWDLADRQGVDPAAMRRSAAAVGTLMTEHASRVQIVCYHDLLELPTA